VDENIFNYLKWLVVTKYLEMPPNLFQSWLESLTCSTVIQGVKRLKRGRPQSVSAVAECL
jgi:hypothetical protein